MTKKVILGISVFLVIISLLLISFFILKKDEVKVISLDSKYYQEYKIEDIDHNKFNELEKNKGNFVVYVTLNGCISCQAFKPIAEEFLETNHLYVYHIEYQEMKQTSMADYVLYSPSMIIFNKGVMYAYLDANSNDDLSAYKSVSGLTDWFSKYIEIK